MLFAANALVSGGRYCNAFAMGSYRWGLFNDPASASRFVETFVVESWAGHPRQHERVTVTDKEIEDIALSFHIGKTPPAISHLIHARDVGIKE